MRAWDHSVSWTRDEEDNGQKEGDKRNNIDPSSTTNCPSVSEHCSLQVKAGSH